MLSQFGKFVVMVRQTSWISISESMFCDKDGEFSCEFVQLYSNTQVEMKDIFSQYEH